MADIAYTTRDGEFVAVGIVAATPGAKLRLTTGTGQIPAWQWAIVALGVTGFLLGLSVIAGW